MPTLSLPDGRGVRSHKASLRLAALASMLATTLLLSACGGSSGGSSLRRFPTAPATRILGIDTPAPASTDLPALDAAPTALVTAPPALALPDATGQTLACPANTLRVPLSTPQGPAAAASRIAALGDDLYLLADGGLYRASLPAANSGTPEMSPILVPGQQVAGRPVQELTDVIADPAAGQVFALDKAGHVFRYEPASALAALSYRAASTDEEPDGLPYQFGAITVDARGRLILLDDAHGALWTPRGIGELETVNETRGLTSASDVAYAGDRFYFVQQDGVIRTATGRSGSETWRDALGTRLAISLRASDHLGTELLLLVDGERHEVDGLVPATGQIVTRHVFVFPEMGLLRDVVFAGGRLYAVADGDLYVYPGPATGSDEVECPAPDSVSARPSLYGQDALGLLRGFRYPIAGGTLPPWPRVYPGAGRIYRLGVHHGLDVYEFNGPPGFRAGWPVIAAADGVVMRATIVYEDMTDEDFENMLALSEAAGQTPPDILQRLEGKQVVIDHGSGVQTTYSHLQDIAPGVVTGARVRAGQTIGSVGVTGTQGEGRPGTVAPHLHFEIWLGEHYLGFGITIREAMWWFEQIFGAEVG